ncbi:hypothetical protein P3X46_011949 [Hevea brasiliensis]|uniref:asparagine--tRNA ligase n=1 Tax=Hevea brasiliensis TaxID=3981 RepID=A0ABQ9MCM2_HEVBR|nr:asparagine--tRNA ligase, cytoplasmic 2 [Hevea brasiliensis]KAJ9176663.1 hypothetical protein P3X46_011949 [Hevea brasiliensis]
MASQEILASQKSNKPSEEPETIPLETEPSTPLIPPSKYSNRVVLRTIIERSDGGVGLVGETMVIGGWVKSARVVRKDPPPQLQSEDNDGIVVRPGLKEVGCMDILQNQVPIFSSTSNIFDGSGNYPARAKLQPAPSKRVATSKPPPLILNLLVIDGSCVDSLQVTIEFSDDFPIRPLPTGTCILAEGVLSQLPAQGKHSIEFKVNKILHLGTVEDDKYILSKKRLPLETLRDYSHLRPRTTTVASFMRIRSASTFATHTFFQVNGFFSVEVPILTTTDEGFSAKFQVTSLSAKEVKKEEPKITGDTEALEVVKAAIKEKNNLIQQLQRSDSDREALLAAEQDLLKTKQLASQLEEKEKLRLETLKAANIPEDFFSQHTYLTVSGVLHLESYACGLGNVYSFGPRFLADRRLSTKQAAEMWMVEAEMAFSELEDAMNCAEDYFKFLCKWVLENCSTDMKFVSRHIDKTNLLEAMISSSCERITYMEAVNVLKKVADRKFETEPEWGTELTSQHLSYLVDEIYKKPVIVYNFPKEFKPFYVRLNDDGKTVAAFDMVAPTVGKFITGSQKEERFDLLNERINELGLPKEQYEWYLDLRRYGTVKHSGFTLGFDLMVLFATGLPDVRDVIPFPRSSGKVDN